MNNSNKRKHERFGVRLIVEVKDRKGKHPLPTGDISRYGLYLITADPRPERQLIQMIIKFPHNGEEIDVMGQVMWCNRGGGQREEKTPGMGIKFFSMPDEPRRMWEEFVELLRAGKIDVDSETASEAAEDDEEAADQAGDVITIGDEELEELGDLDLEDIETDDNLIEFEEESGEEIGSKTGPGVIDLSGVADKYGLELPEIDEEVVEDLHNEERRIFPRKAATFMIRMADISQMREFYTRDISLGGLFLKTNMERKVGDKVNLVIVHPWSAEEFELPSEVKRIEIDVSGEQNGLGLQFAGMSDLLRDSLLVFIETGFVVKRSSVDVPAESDVIRQIEIIENGIRNNPIDESLHFKVGMLYTYISDWNKAREHLEIAGKLGRNIPEAVHAKLQ